jgi:hypothetical protein
MSTQSYGASRVGSVVSVWSTDRRRSLRKIAETSLRDGETLVPHPREHDEPGRPSRFRIEKAEVDPRTVA